MYQQLERLSIASPVVAQKVDTMLADKKRTVSEQDITMLVEETIWGLSIEPNFGESVAKGFVNLFDDVTHYRIKLYQTMVRQYGTHGPSLGTIMAKVLVPVLKVPDDNFLTSFMKLVDTMRCKGTYTLQSPFKALKLFLESGDLESGEEYMMLLSDIFSKPLTYNRSLVLTEFIPKFSMSLNPLKRLFQLRQFGKVIGTNPNWAESFEEGMNKGLNCLSEDSLNYFVQTGVDKYKSNDDRGKTYFSIGSGLGQELFESLQITVGLSQISRRLNDYLRARTGLHLMVAPVSSLNKTVEQPQFTVCSDGKTIYLPDEIGVFPTKEQNLNLYKSLLRLEAGNCELGTFMFDLEKCLEKLGMLNLADTQDLKTPDLEFFFSLFPVPKLALDIFNAFEQGRVRKKMESIYPGLIRNVIPLLWQEAISCIETIDINPISYLYARISLNMSDKSSKAWASQIEQIIEFFNNNCVSDTQVEDIATWVWQFYPIMLPLTESCHDVTLSKDTYKPINIPFGRGFKPELIYFSSGDIDIKTKIIRRKLKEKGILVYQSDTKKRLLEKDGTLSINDIMELAHARATDMEISLADIKELLKDPHFESFDTAPAPTCPVTWYREWDDTLGDYLLNHARILSRRFEDSSPNFYNEALSRNHGLLIRIRRSFELLRPEGLVILRKWLEGDEFDYRALLDYGIDRKMRKTPSERLYIKRIKQQRDVVVLLLVDLSRSTNNPLPDSSSTVLDIEKEAIVLFCEALEKSKDRFAIAGFSGNGRLSVDYYHIKDIEETFDETIKNRIGAIRPLRSTRMGAAIRHATQILEKVSSKVRLMIILGDGFPNDIDYKKTYAIKDTRMSIREANTKGLHVHGITVNLSSEAKLDDLFGKGKHTVISDVRELPDKLPRIYRSLTRQSVDM